MAKNHRLRNNGDVIFAAAILAIPQIEVNWEQGVRNQLLQHIEELSPSGTPGTLSVFGENSTVVLTSGNKPPQVLAAAARYGKGRVFAIAHSGYLSGLSDSRTLPRDASSIQQLMYNVKRWAGGGPKSPKMVDLSESIDEWRNADIFIWRGKVNLNAQQQQDLLRLIENGAGLIMAECPWGWAQVTGKSLQEQMPQNQFLRNFGIVFGGGYAATNSDGGYAVKFNKPDSAHAGVAIKKLKAGLSLNVGENKAVEALLANLSMRSPTMDDLRDFFGELEGNPPSEKQPLTAKDSKDRFWVSMFSNLWKAAAPSEITAIAGSEIFPGHAQSGAKPVTRVFDFVKSHSGWYSTGLFLSAGEAMNIKLIGGDPSKWMIRIGCHSDRLWGKDTWSRWPEISHTLELETVVELGCASPWGGLVYFVPKSGAGNLRLQVSGAVEAPEFVAGNDKSKRQWRVRRNSPAPWGELVGKHIILSVPSNILRELDNPEAVCEYWDKLWVSHCQLAAIEVPQRPERFVADQQISAGYMHSGYPIMTWLDVVTAKKGKLAPVLDLEKLTTEGNWGYFHELGHNRQRAWWTFSGTGEVTNNLFSLHGGEVMAGIVPWENKWLRGQKKSAAKYLRDGADFSVWKKKPDIALVCFALIQREFGWEPFTEFFASFEYEPAGIRPSSDKDKIDQWIIRLSKEVAHDLRPYFESWAWPISDKVKQNDALNQLPVWEVDNSWMGD